MASGVKARIALLIQAQGAKRAEAEIQGVSRSTKKLGDESVIAGSKTRKGGETGASSAPARSVSAWAWLSCDSAGPNSPSCNR